MNYLRLILAGIVFLLMTINTQAQKKKEKNLELDTKSLEGDSIPNLDVELEMTEEELALDEQQKQQKERKKKKKKKKKIYFGIKTKGGFIKKPTGSSITLELFRMVGADLLMKDPYQQEVHFYDVKARKVKSTTYYNFKSRLKKGQNLYLLHGKYEKFKNKVLRVEGYYYKGLKHGKWREFNSKEILLEKIQYHLGYTYESFITYYDAGETKVKEVVPMVHGRKQGVYYYFHENGAIALAGKYENNTKVGMWREWYDRRNKKTTKMYPTRWWEEKEPVLLQKWNESGKLVYDVDRGGKLN